MRLGFAMEGDARRDSVGENEFEGFILFKLGVRLDRCCVIVDNCRLVR